MMTEMSATAWGLLFNMLGVLCLFWDWWIGWNAPRTLLRPEAGEDIDDYNSRVVQHWHGRRVDLGRGNMAKPKGTPRRR